MEIQKALSTLENEIDNVSEGLPYELFLFISQVTPLICVDLLIKDEQHRTLYTWRDDAFFGKGWHLPGGVIRHNETIEQRIVKVGELELGAKITFELEPCKFVQDIDKTKKYRGHFLAFLYKCRIDSDLDVSIRYNGGKPKIGEWAWFSSAPEPLLKVHEVYKEFL